MPRYVRRRRAPRRPRRRATTYRKKRSLNQASRSYICKTVGEIITSGTGTISHRTFPSGVTTTATYTNLSALYDNFEVTAISVKYVPYNLYGIDASVATFKRGNMGSVVDMDGLNYPNGNFTLALQYGSFKMHSSARTIYKYLPIPKRYRPQMNDFNVGWNTQNLDSTIEVLGDGFGNSARAYYIFIKYYIKCYGRR